MSKQSASSQLCSNPLSAGPTKWSNTQTIRRQKPTSCLIVFDHFVGLVLKGLTGKINSFFLCVLLVVHLKLF